MGVGREDAMNLSKIVRVAVLAALSSSLTACVESLDARRGPGVSPAERLAFARDVTGEWSDASRLVAGRLLEEYGAPDEVSRDRLIWRGNAPWRRTVVTNIQPPLVSDDRELGVLSQTVRVSLSPSQAAAVEAIDGAVVYDPRGGELTARGDREEVDILRLNLAVDVAESRLSVDEARRAFARDLLLEASGKTVEDMRTLRVAGGP